jgi:four helix bundle protein
MKIIKFEEIKAWQEARILTKEIYDITSKTLFNKDYGLKDQIRRASSSIMLNIAEGFDGGSNQQFIQFLIYAKRSCSEVQSALYISLDNDYINEQDFHILYKRTELIRKLCSGLIKYLKTNKNKLSTG